MEIKIVSINGQEVNSPKFQDKETDTETFFYDESFEDYKKNPFANIEEATSFSMILSIEFEEGEITEENKEKLEKLKLSEEDEKILNNDKLES